MTNPAQRTVIVAHGQPSDPASAAADLARLARDVASLLPGWQVASATLAEPDALARATSAGAGGLIYPLFMTGGWFTRVHLPARLAAINADGWRVLEPFGCDPALHDLAATVVAEAVAELGAKPSDVALLLAAHGSGKSPVPADVARHVTARIVAATGIGRAESAFIDQVPQLAQASGYGPFSLCLPYFAAAGGHVTDDIPAALATAGFAGRLLPALGLDRRIPALIAQALIAGVPVCATECRYRNGG